MIDTVTVGLPVAGINELSVQFGGGMRRVISATAPTDTAATWIDPETGIQSVYSGGGWVTQLTATIVDDVPIFSSQPGVNAANVVGVLAGQDIAVASIGLEDGTGTSLAAGRLSLNASSEVVIHDNESNAEDLPHLVNSRESISFASSVLPASMDNVTFTRKLHDIPLPASALTNGKRLHLIGRSFALWTSGNKPDTGVYLVLCKEGQDPATEGMYFNLAEGVTTENRDFHIATGFSVTAGVWSLLYLSTTPSAIIHKNAAGTITQSDGWSFGTDWGESAVISGTAGDPVKLELHVMTIDSSDSVTATLFVSGQLSAISQ